MKLTRRNLMITSTAGIAFAAMGTLPAFASLTDDEIAKITGGAELGDLRVVGKEDSTIGSHRHRVDLADHVSRQYRVRVPTWQRALDVPEIPRHIDGAIRGQITRSIDKQALHLLRGLDQLHGSIGFELPDRFLLPQIQLSGDRLNQVLPDIALGYPFQIRNHAQNAFVKT